MNADISTVWTATVPAADDAAIIASWSSTAAEAAAWVSSPAPVTAEVVRGWWRRPDVTARLLLDPDGIPVAYGEVWDDEDEDEVELARIIVSPHRRCQGIGRRLVELLLDLAEQHQRSDCFLRVVPDNTAACALYRSTGFLEVDEATMAEWNAGQPTRYIWMQHSTS